MGKAGRKSKAEELGLVELKNRFVKRLPKFGPKTTEQDVMRFLQLVNEGQLAALLTSTEAGDLRSSAALALRALRQHHAHRDVPELEQLLERVEEMEARVAARGANERNKTR